MLLVHGHPDQKVEGRAFGVPVYRGDRMKIVWNMRDQKTKTS